ncbi:MAG: hypothetical protein LH614_14945 [Pyrinomonadaceae bacterium]|nr:hypothetical protein [Pyrinomonadaceae bacterium]
MNNQITIQKSEKGWILELPDEFAESIGVEKNSIGLLGYKDGKIEVEVLPPPSPELKESVDRIFNKYKDAFEEMKRLGD